MLQRRRVRSRDLERAQQYKREASHSPGCSNPTVLYVHGVTASKDTFRLESSAAAENGARRCTRISWCEWSDISQLEAFGGEPGEVSSGQALIPVARGDTVNEEGNVQWAAQTVRVECVLNQSHLFCIVLWVIFLRQDSFFPCLPKGKKRTAISRAKWADLIWIRTNGITNTEE